MNKTLYRAIGYFNTHITAAETVSLREASSYFFSFLTRNKVRCRIVEVTTGKELAFGNTNVEYGLEYATKEILDFIVERILAETENQR